MKKGFFTLCVLSALRAFGQEAANPEDMNLTFDTDLYAIEPKMTFSIGARTLTGMKANFSGSGQVASELRNNDPTTEGVTRLYHDGAVGADARRISIDDGNGGTIFVPITSDGLTNNWRYSDSRQVQPDGTIAMHTYSADIANAGPREKDPKSSYGLELRFNRDGGQLTPHLHWSLGGGVGINGISSILSHGEAATVTTVTDTYSLAGASVPPAPYATSKAGGNGLITENVFDANGNAVLNSDGTPATHAIDSTVLIADVPQTRETTVANSTTNFTNHFRVRGAFFTFRAGPTLIFPITQRIKVTLSLGAAVVFAGTEYDVEEDFQPDTADPIKDTVTNRTSRLLPGYFVDANMEYTLTDRAGLYAGAVYQSTGSYTQKIQQVSANYQTKIDLSAMSGFHAGMNVRF